MANPSNVLPPLNHVPTLEDVEALNVVGAVDTATKLDSLAVEAPKYNWARKPAVPLLKTRLPVVYAGFTMKAVLSYLTNLSGVVARSEVSFENLTVPWAKLLTTINAPSATENNIFFMLVFLFYAVPWPAINSP